MQGGPLLQFYYLCCYFDETPQGTGAGTILVEEPYVSRSYLIDYAAYYARCHEPYERFCKRVHFFKGAWKQEDLEQQLLNPVAGPVPEYLFQNGLERTPFDELYLGYLVVKPVPFTFLGATLLKPYPISKEKQRSFKVLRTYEIHFPGRTLSLETLPFQVQDRATSACASVALWAAFHKMGALFQTPTPSPSEISQSAGLLNLSNGRIFPNDGLNELQIIEAIQHVGLEAEFRIRKNWNRQTVLGFIHAYMNAGLPVLLGLRFKGGVLNGEHLVTLTGYRKEPRLPLYQEQFDESDKEFTQFDLESDQIETFYAHDDQLGPFSRILFDRDHHLSPEIISGWPQAFSFEDDSRVRAKSVFLIVPIYPKIRVPFFEILRIIEEFDVSLDFLLRAGKQQYLRNYWNIVLENSTEFKQQLAGFIHHVGAPDSMLSHYQERWLFRNMPRFIWRAGFFLAPLEEHKKPGLMMELVFDASDVPNGQHFMGAVFYHLKFTTLIHERVGDGTFQASVRYALGEDFFRKFKVSVQQLIDSLQ